MSSTTGSRSDDGEANGKEQARLQLDQPTAGRGTESYRMKPFAPIIAIAAVALLIVSCAHGGASFAYTGVTDVSTIAVSSQAAGLIDSLVPTEGDSVRKGELLGQINVDSLVAQRKQQEAQLTELDVKREATAAQVSQAQAQIAQARAQLGLARDTLAKTETLLTEGGATRQSRDELATQVQVDQAGLASGEANLIALQSNYKLIAAQEEELKAGMEITDIAIRNARIVSPLSGIVLDKFHHAGELAGVGTPLLEIANLSEMTVEIYVPLAKLARVKLDQRVRVSVEGLATPLLGTVYWIASQSEFTPKTILTQETRTSLVYGVKIRVANTDGYLKIGMPVEVQL